jgi:hypothetical protein
LGEEYHVKANPRVCSRLAGPDARRSPDPQFTLEPVGAGLLAMVFSMAMQR